MARTAEKITVSSLKNRIAKVRIANSKIAAVRAAAETVIDPEAKKLVLSSVSDLAILVVNARKRVIAEIFDKLSEKGTPEDLELLVDTFAHFLESDGK